MPVLLLATLDTKGTEAAFLRDRLVELGVEVRVVDTGCLGDPAIASDVTREEFYRLGPTPLAKSLRISGLLVTDTRSVTLMVPASA